MFRQTSVVRRAPAPEATETSTSFPLLKYFGIAALFAVLIGAGLSSFLFGNAADSEFERQSTQAGLADAEHVAQLLQLTVWAPVHEALPDLEFGDAIHPKMMELFSQQAVLGLDVVGINLWGVDGSLVWSSDRDISKVISGTSARYESVITSGSPVSELRRNHRVSSGDGEVLPLDVVRSYYPVVDDTEASASGGSVIGVLEITQDVTVALATSSSAVFRASLRASLATGLVLLSFLLLVAVRADRAIRRIYGKLAKQQDELREAEERRSQSTKMAAMGELVANVAHELNNPMTSISGVAELILERDADPQTQHEVGLIYEEAQRSQRIVQNLLSFARARESEKSYCSINAAIDAAIELRRYHLMVNDVTVALELDPNLPRTVADPYKLQQVILNLVTNAAHAMTETNGGGHIAIQTKRVDGQIQITVVDNGPGIDDQLIDKIFDPFFTTKSDGQGTGLGLSICYSIVQEHGGSITARSDLDRGTEFLVRLPILAEGDEAPPIPDGENIRPNITNAPSSERMPVGNHAN